MADPINWFDWFFEFFDEVKERLTVVLGAAGCRESWLQGEIYRRAHDEHLWLRTNESSVLLSKEAGKGRRPTVDLFALGLPPMVGEIKVIVPGSTVGDRDIDKDVQKLQRRSNPEKIEAYIVLVIQESEEPTRSEDRLKKLGYPDKPVVRHYGDFEVRIWRVGEEPDGQDGQSLGR